MMFKKILVCLDGSKLAETILPYAVEQAKRFDSELILFRAFSENNPLSLAMPGMPGVPLDSKNVERHFIETELEVETYLKTAASRIQSDHQLNVSYESALGAAGPAIVEYCSKNKIDLITIATHGRSGLGRAVLGSVADYVIRHSGVPIMLIRPNE
jgi:nucleotide-binding universal stress UspA family protein